METQNIRFEVEGAVGILTIDRPKSLNALSVETLREILRCLRDLRRGGSVRCLIVTGAGEKAFVAGADIAAMSSMTAVEAKEFSRLGQRVTASLEELPIPVIAAVNGFALGGGFGSPWPATSCLLRKRPASVSLKSTWESFLDSAGLSASSGAWVRLGLAS